MKHKDSKSVRTLLIKCILDEGSLLFGTIPYFKAYCVEEETPESAWLSSSESN